MSFWNSVFVKKARKQHQCAYCFCHIQEGIPCWHETGTHEDEFNDYYLCERCKKLIVFGGIWYDGDELGEFEDNLWETDFLMCPKCKSYNTHIDKYFDSKTRCSVICEDCDNEYNVDLSAENLLEKEE
jgi:uncharacterized protein YbaR (Trm112 family)